MGIPVDSTCIEGKVVGGGGGGGLMVDLVVRSSRVVGTCSSWLP